MVTVCPEQPDDIAGIRRVQEAAFPTAAEARLVDALRASGRLRLSLVAEMDGGIVGHIAFSPVRLDGLPACPDGLGLAPLAVLPDFQGQGAGSRLVREGLAACARASCPYVVVLGAPAYYGRFGFAPASRWGLRDEFGGGDAFMAVELQAGGIPPGAGLVRYAPEFDEWVVQEPS
jgi:putative acetyltransferase